MGAGSGKPYRDGVPCRLATLHPDFYSEEEVEEIMRIVIDYTRLLDAHKTRTTKLIQVRREMQKYPRIFERAIEDIQEKLEYQASPKKYHPRRKKRKGTRSQSMWVLRDGGESGKRFIGAV